MKRYDVRPSIRSSAPSACCSGVRWVWLLLWVRRVGDIGRLLQQRRANAGSATLSAYVGS